jgi:uncharacterized hydrophobic protein (TIGR00271 family)
MGEVIHLRIVSPPGSSVRLVPLLDTHPAVFNLTVLRDVAHDPGGDAIERDVLQGAGNEVVTLLRDLELDQKRSISFENVDTAISATMEQARVGRSRFDEFAPVWEEVEARIRSGGRFPPSWYALLVIAGLIAAVGILTNSQILIVAAMVVGPEYGAIMSMGFGITTHDTARFTSSSAALVVGFGLSVIGTLLLGLIVRASSLTPMAYTLGIRPVSNLINTPDWFSFIVAVLAGIVGVVAITEARASTLIGVFISVTTIPAAADIGLSTAYQSWHEAWGSALQLLLNVTVLWRWLPSVSPCNEPCGGAWRERRISSAQTASPSADWYVTVYPHW